MDYTVLILVLAAIVTAGVETAAADVVTVMITPASTSGKPGIKVPFVGTATSSAGAKITTWTWNFGDKIWCTSPNFCGLSVAHTYPNIGVYAVTLTATDATGASGTGTATVTVSKDALNVVATVLSGQGMTHGQPVTIGYTDSGSTSQITTITTSCGDGSAPVVQNLFYQPPAANGQLTITGTTGGTSAWICIYAAAGDYEAQVSVTDTLGVTASAQADVMVITQNCPNVNLWKTAIANGQVPGVNFYALPAWITPLTWTQGAADIIYGGTAKAPTQTPVNSTRMPSIAPWPGSTFYFCEGLRVEGGTAPYSYSVQNAPPGLTVNADGNYGGTATTPGWYPNIVFCATDAAKATNCALPRQQLVCTLGAATCISPQ